ncbi:MAG: hypothetical protein ABFS34_07705 [Gemmatimonadota bacterium]
MDVEEFLAVVAVFAIIVLPALALTSRFALKPIVEAIIMLREGLAGKKPDEDAQHRLTMIEAELSELGASVRRLADAHEYDRQLTAPREHDRTSGSSEA